MEKYSLVQRLGQGSFAVVWKARRKSDGRLVAVKQLKQSPESWEACKQLPEDWSSFSTWMDSVRAAAAVADRRHLVQLLEAVRHGGELFLVFEYIEGSLHHCIATATRRIEESQVRWAARRLLMALAAVHAANLVHCDVKPENILVGGLEGGRAPTMKLCDFGQSGPPGEIASYIGTGSSDRSIGGVPMSPVLGGRVVPWMTRWYRAPELFLGTRGDSSVDLWSAGCTIAELILRRPLVPGSDTRDMLFRICGELGAPEESWPLAAQLVEASGRANAEPAAWQALRDQGAAETTIELLAGLLRYDGAKRTRAERGLREPFFIGEPEAPIPVPTPRPMSPSSLQHAREEAQAVERRLASAGKATLPPPPAPSYSGTREPVRCSDDAASGLLGAQASACARAVVACQPAMSCLFSKGQEEEETAPQEEAILKLPNGTEHRIKVLKPTCGQDAFLDIRDLHRATGYFSYDPGFTCTGSCLSAITFIDGPKGVCLYRGYSVAYLLLVGEKPSVAQLAEFRKEIQKHMLVHEKVKAMFSNFTINAHPMAIMVAVIGALSCIFSELDPLDEEHRWLACKRLIAKVPVLACWAYKTSIGALAGTGGDGANHWGTAGDGRGVQILLDRVTSL
eukprot:g27004.t1